MYSYVSSKEFQQTTSHVLPVLTLALLSIKTGRCALPGCSALAFDTVLDGSAMVAAVIAGQGSGVDKNLVCGGASSCTRTNVEGYKLEGADIASGGRRICELGNTELG